MGSNSSKAKNRDTSQYGQIYLKTDKTAYYAGETVTGIIFANLLSHYPGHQLFLQFKGKEAAHVVRAERKNSHTEEVMDSKKREIIKQSSLVYSWDDMVAAPGQFKIPFSFLLPKDLPPSFYQQGHRYFAFIEYQLVAFIKPHQDKIPKMKYKQQINLREKIEKPIAGDLSSNITTVLETWFCCKQGSNILKVNFEKNFYAPGEKAQVSVELDNSGTSLKNLSIFFCLKQRLELRAGSEAKTLDLVKVWKQLPGIPEGSHQNAGSLEVTLPRSLSETDFNTKIDKKEPNKATLIELKENYRVITSTTNSSLITSAFYLEVSCSMSGCCATTPLAICPIGIVSPDFQLPVVIAPSNWQPVTLDRIALAFPPTQNRTLLKSEQESKMIEGQMIQNPISQPPQQLGVGKADISE